MNAVPKEPEKVQEGDHRGRVNFAWANLQHFTCKKLYGMTFEYFLFYMIILNVLSFCLKLPTLLTMERYCLRV